MSIQISFDDLNRIRLLDPEEFKQAEALADESTSFINKLGQFTKLTDALVEVLKTQSDKIEQEKLLAIGQRNRIEIEIDTRKRREQEAQSLIAQKQAELHRITEYYNSLLRVEQEQLLIIDKLTSA